ncbi:MAG: ABC transporter ATP-binding protein, partial [Candidatus Thermoplasmatota archaeon]|nr:ABC transporter ATP-binding protein [Candidatus Thermoplasmatota archaeon]
MSIDGPVIKVMDLTKRYGKVSAVAGIDLSVDRGEVFAFLGPNGAGKTTTVEIIEGIRKPTSGSVEVLGRDMQRNGPEIKPRIGVLPQEFSSFDKITVKETLSFYSSLYKNGRRPDELMELLGI